jgi:phytoene synthase
MRGDAAYTTLSNDPDVATCERVLRDGSASFATAARLLPRRVRGPATVLYAFCRKADDAIDLTPDAGDRAIDALRARLAAAYAGTPNDDPVDRAFAKVVGRERIPQALFEALLEGLQWDAHGKTYASLPELYTYAARVAGTVGAMMTVVMGARSAEALARACDLGVAMQLTNIARDVGEDARRGRVYLPLEWMREAGVDPATWLERPVHTPALGAVVARLLAAAEDLYARAHAGIALLPSDCRLAIGAARRIYADIGRAVRDAGYDAVTRRAYVTRRRKLWLLARAIGDRHLATSPPEPPLDAVRFLVLACADSP